MHDLLTAPTSTQDIIINTLASEALKNNYIGWQFDFEHIYYTDRDAYTAFVERAGNIFKQHNLQLSIAAVSRSSDIETDHYKNWSGAFDYARIAASVDFISIMTYDDPNSQGPVASMPFVTSVQEYLKDKVPAEKLSLGVPFYYWGWQALPFIKIRTNGTYERLNKLRQTYNVTEGFNTDFKVPFLIYSKDGQQYVVWHEDAVSLTHKLDLAKNNGLRGISAWVLGMENPSVWNALDLYK
jgi:spore germination protein